MITIANVLDWLSEVLHETAWRLRRRSEPLRIQDDFSRAGIDLSPGWTKHHLPATDSQASDEGKA